MTLNTCWARDSSIRVGDSGQVIGLYDTLLEASFSQVEVQEPFWSQHPELAGCDWVLVALSQACR